MIQKHICTPMLIAALFGVGKTWKQPKCPSTGMDKGNVVVAQLLSHIQLFVTPWCIYMVEYYSAIKKNGI